MIIYIYGITNQEKAKTGCHKRKRTGSANGWLCSLFATSLNCFAVILTSILPRAELSSSGSRHRSPRARLLAPARSTKTKHTSRTIIRATWLRRLPDVHRSSIYQVFCLGSWQATRACESTHPGVGFALRCVQRFSRLDVATRRWVRPPNRYTSGPAAPVLSY